jgi:hypothetical protein
MAVRKPFEKHLYDKYDNKAKAALVEILEKRGHTITSVSENYYADVESEYKGYTFYSEAEIKTAWKGDWPPDWLEIRLPERKSRLIKKYNGCVDFYIFDNNADKCWRIEGRNLTEDMLRPAFGRNIRKGEKFFHIPYEQAELVILNG